MIVSIELFAGQNRKEPTKKDIEKNINALYRSIKHNSISLFDELLIMDSITILEKIKKQLSEGF